MPKRRFPTSTIKEIQFESLTKSPLASFMMASAVAYNDIKLFHFLKSVVANQYASCDGTNAHSGEYAGLMWQTIKFVLALIHEYLKLVREYEDEFKSDPFKKIISAMPKHAQESWEIVHSAALGATRGLDKQADKELYQLLSKIRNNTAFHYYQPKGIINSVLTALDSNPTLKAFVSMGTTMEETRFHFADRAIQIYIEQECSKQNWQPKDFEPFIERINVTLYHLVAKYTQEVSN